MIIYFQMLETDEERSKFEEIYKTYRNLMFYIAYKRLGNEHDAEDVVHHAFVKVAENVKKVELPCPKTKQFVVTIVDNQITDLFRARGRHPVLEYQEGVQHGSHGEPEGVNLLEECILKLPERQRMVIWLKYVHGYNLREIAHLLGISLFSAQKIDHRAKKKLEELYREGGGLL